MTRRSRLILNDESEMLPSPSEASWSRLVWGAASLLFVTGWETEPEAESLFEVAENLTVALDVFRRYHGGVKWGSSSRADALL